MNRRNTLIGAVMLAAALATASLAQAAGFKSDRFSVVVEGQGPDVILVPGLSSSRHVWDGVADHLKATHRVHLLQLGGFAGEPVGGNAAGPVSAPVAEDIARYIEAEHLKAPAVIGHSMGGTITMMLAARHPADVGRAMVIDMPPFLGMFYAGPSATPDSVKPMAAQIRAGIATSPQADYEKRLTDTIAGMVKTEAVRPIYVKEGLDSDRDVSGRAMEELITTDLRPELKNITAPLTVLYVWTPAYPMTAEQLDAGYQALFASVPTVRTTRIPDSYHFIMVDQPERLNSEIDAFLK
jgi:pimeloyl-ACP methyl ester carboxylesterase